MIKKPLDSKYLDPTYPRFGMPFYLYGSTQDSEYHIDHTLVAAPNTQLTGGEVSIPPGVISALPPFTEASPYIKIVADFPERAMQPFPPNKDIAQDNNFFFRPNKVLPFTVEGSNVKGSLTLTKNVFVDTDMLNEDPVPKPHKDPVPTGRHERTGECYVREYSLRAHAYAVALVGTHVHITHVVPDTIAPGRGWQDIVVCTWSITWCTKPHIFIPRIPLSTLLITLISRIHCIRRVIHI